MSGRACGKGVPLSVRSNSTCPTHQLVDDVRRIVASQPVWDVHTHLYSPAFGSPLAGSGHTSDPNGLLLWGVDELLTYHYLVAEVFRVLPTEQSSTAAFWKMTKRQQADLIWQHLFTQRAPLSEACRGVVTTLAQLGLDPNERSLDSYRRWFAAQDQNQHIDRVMELAGVERIVMTNNVFDDNERNRWLNEPTAGSDPRFVAVLRFDPLLRIGRRLRQVIGMGIRGR